MSISIKQLSGKVFSYPIVAHNILYVGIWLGLIIFHEYLKASFEVGYRGLTFVSYLVFSVISLIMINTRVSNVACNYMASIWPMGIIFLMLSNLVLLVNVLDIINYQIFYLVASANLSFMLIYKDKEISFLEDFVRAFFGILLLVFLKKIFDSWQMF